MTKTAHSLMCGICSNKHLGVITGVYLPLLECRQWMQFPLPRKNYESHPLARTSGGSRIFEKGEEYIIFQITHTRASCHDTFQNFDTYQVPWHVPKFWHVPKQDFDTFQNTILTRAKTTFWHVPKQHFDTCQNFGMYTRWSLTRTRFWHIYMNWYEFDTY